MRGVQFARAGYPHQRPGQVEQWTTGVTPAGEHGGRQQTVFGQDRLAPVAEPGVARAIIVAEVIGAVPPEERIDQRVNDHQVIGPDGLLYVSNFPNLLTGLGGQVLRFNPETRAFIDVFITSAGGVGELNRPEGLVFGPNGKLYITSFRDSSQPSAVGNTDMIRIYNNDRFAGKIDLYQVGNTADPCAPRAFAQALLFGPKGRLFVPITGGGPCAGQVRSYKEDTRTFDVFVPPMVGGGPLGTPEYLTFGKTDPATLAYDENE